MVDLLGTFREPDTVRFGDENGKPGHYNKIVKISSQNEMLYDKRERKNKFNIVSICSRLHQENIESYKVPSSSLRIKMACLHRTEGSWFFTRGLIYFPFSPDNIYLSEDLYYHVDGFGFQSYVVFLFNNT